MTPISQRQFARHRGVCVSTVVKWKLLGRVFVLPSGMIDMETSDEMLDSRPYAYRGGVVGGTPLGWRAAGAYSDMTLEELNEAVDAMAREFERE